MLRNNIPIALFSRQNLECESDVGSKHMDELQPTPNEGVNVPFHLFRQAKYF